jgi:hypothetical protein
MKMSSIPTKNNGKEVSSIDKVEGLSTHTNLYSPSDKTIINNHCELHPTTDVGQAEEKEVIEACVRDDGVEQLSARHARIHNGFQLLTSEVDNYHTPRQGWVLHALKIQGTIHFF